MYPILTQIIGAIGYSILASSYFRKQKKDILLMQIVAHVLFTVHYYMLDGITGAVCNVLGLIALFIIYLFDEYKFKNKKLLVICMIPFVVGISMITYKDIFSLFPIVASVTAIVSFTTDKEQLIRIIGIICAVCWLIYAIVYGSYAAIIFEVVTLIFIIMAVFKNKK